MANTFKTLSELRTARLAGLGLSPTGLSIPPSIPVPECVRVVSNIRVITSKIEDAGRGMAVLENVKDRERIFEIDEPMFTVVNSGEHFLINTCDSCFASKDHRTGFDTVPDKYLKLRACTRCRLAYYCSKDCQTTAWEEYHRYECKCLKAMDEYTFGYGPKCDDSKKFIKLVHLAPYRFMVRLLKLDQFGKIPEAQWAEIRNLSWNKAIREHDYSYIGAKTIAKHIMGMTRTKRPEDLVLKLILISSANVVDMSLNLIRPWGKDYKWSSPFALKAGRCIDPFISMINHSCCPNAMCCFEGRKCFVVAVKDISAGDEICISYINYSNYKVRQQELKDVWGFTCTCQICLSQRDTVRSFTFHEFMQAGKINLQNIPIIPLDIDEGPEVHEISKFHMTVHFKNNWINHLRKGEHEKAFKNCMRLYFLGMIRSPPISVHERLDVLYHMLHLFDSWPIVQNELCYSHLKIQMRITFAAQLELIYGSDSAQVIHEINKAMKARRVWEKRYRMEWTSYFNNRRGVAEVRQQYILFLGWAGIPFLPRVFTP